MSYRCNILILDDEPIVGDRLKTLLEKDGHRVEIFTDSFDALRCLEAKPFDIVISDIRMPEMDGIQVMNRIFQTSGRIKVILITGYATLELARESLTKGAFDFIAKPFKSKEIRQTIQKAADALHQNDSRPPQQATA